MSSSDAPIELVSKDERNSFYREVADAPETPAPADDVPPSLVKRLHLKLFSAAFSFFVAGANDGSMGALLPYILKDYHIGTGLIALL